MLFDNIMKWVDSFVPMDTEVMEGSKSQAEGSKKRIREELDSDNSKKQKIDENVEAEVDDEEEMKKHMEIVPNDEVAIDAIPLATKSLIIIDRKSSKKERWDTFKSLELMVVQGAKHGNTRPEEAYERVLWGDLKVMFEPDVESEVWRNLQGYNVTVWKLFSSSGVHFVRFQNLHIFMLGRIVGIKRLHDDLGVNIAKLDDAQPLGRVNGSRFMGMIRKEMDEEGRTTRKMLQKIVCQLAILGENISQEDLNLKFLRSLPFEWNTRFVVWWNMAFVSSPSITNEVNTAYGVSTANTQVNPASTQVSTVNLSDDVVYPFLANQLNGSQLVYKDLEQIHEDDIEEMDLKW
ncbi:hypothetical protein Tco_0781775 [Tanacetum coccineum]